MKTRYVADSYRGRAALDYDRKRGASLYGRLYQAANERAIAASCASLRHRVRRALDVPCGTGRLLPIIRSLATDVVGSDISPDMLTLTKRKHAGSPDASYKLVLSDVTHLAFKDRAFDAVFCVKLLHLVTLDGWRELLSELQRVSSTYVIVTAPIKYGELWDRLKSRFTKRRTAGRARPSWVEARNLFTAANLHVVCARRTLPLISDEVIFVLTPRSIDA